MAALGGYVKIAGMVDESMDKEQLAKPAQPWEFRSKPAWQRLIIMLGGVTVNLILGVLIYAGSSSSGANVTCAWTTLPYGMSFAQLRWRTPASKTATSSCPSAETVTRKPATFSDLVFGGQVTSAEVVRDGAPVVLDFPVELGQVLVDRKEDIPEGDAPFSINFPTIIDRVMTGSAAERAGLEPGDRILAVQGQSTPYFSDLIAALGIHAGQTVKLDVVRTPTGEAEGNPELTGQPLGVERHPVPACGRRGADGKIGFYPKEFKDLDGFTFTEREFGPLEALDEGASKTWTTLTNYVSSLRFLFRPGGTQQLGGFITLGSIFSPQWNWRSFWNITALLSIILAFMNLLPIPALDGGT